MKYPTTRFLLLFSILLISLPSFAQTKKLDSSFVHQWAVVVSSETGEIRTDKKPFDAYPSELPNTIEFFSNGTLTMGTQKGSWETLSKEILQIVVDGKSYSYRVSKLQNKKLKLQQLNGKKNILILTQLD